jgi:hypothetical protein
MRAFLAGVSDVRHGNTFDANGATNDVAVKV